jgi:SAM-dependent methyltransferase
MNSFKLIILNKIEKVIFGGNYNKYKSGQLALEKLVKDYEFDTVLDIGCGNGYASDYFTKHGKKVTANDYGLSPNFKDTMAENVIIGDFNKIDFGCQFDAIWCAHCLEHQLNVQVFLEKIHSLLHEGGVLAITVPPLKNTIVGGHVSLWNAGLLVYRLILAGFDCSEASVCRYGYNISVIVRKKSINVLDKIVYDTGDIRTLEAYWPKDIKMSHKERDCYFYGWINKLNW